MQGSLLETLEKPGEMEYRELTLRNYIPKSQALKRFVKPAPTLVGETEIAVMHEVRAAVTEFHRQQSEPLSILPKRPNWDLKRDLNKKMESLDRRTEAALAELLSLNLSQSKEDLQKNPGNGSDEDSDHTKPTESLLKAIDLQSRLDLSQD